MPKIFEIAKPSGALTLAQRLVSQTTDEYDAKLKAIEDNSGAIAECEAIARRLAATGILPENQVAPVVTVHPKGIFARVHVFFASIGATRTAIRCAGLEIAREELDKTFGDMTFDLAGLDCPVVADRSASELAAAA